MTTRVPPEMQRRMVAAAELTLDSLKGQGFDAEQSLGILLSSLILNAFEVGLPPSKLSEVVQGAYMAQLGRLSDYPHTPTAEFARKMLELEHG